MKSYNISLEVEKYSRIGNLFDHPLILSVDTLYISYFHLQLFLIRSLGATWVGGSGSENLRKLKSRCQLRLQLFERLTIAIGATSKVAHLHA